MPKFFQKLPRKKSQQFLLKNNVFRLAQKVTTIHLGFSLRKFVTEKFQKSPNLVTLNCSPTLPQICALTPSTLSLSLSHLQAFPQTFLLLRRALSLSHIQCDQSARSIVYFLAIYSTENVHDSIKNRQIMLE